MNFENTYKTVMDTDVNIALGTIVEGRSSVRLINFIFSKEKSGVIYFATFEGNDKIKEMDINNTVSFITVPRTKPSFVRVREAKAFKSDLSIHDLELDFVRKDQNYEALIKESGDKLKVYEIHFDKAEVTIDYMNVSTIEV